MALVLAALAGAAILLIFIGFIQGTGPQQDGLAARLSAYGAGPRVARQVSDAGERGEGMISRALSRQIAKQSFAASLQTDLARADLKLTVTEFVMLTFVSVILCTALGWFLFSYLGILGIPLGYFLPKLYVSWRKSARLAAFNAQLGETINLMASSLRSGYSMLQSMEMVSRETQPPIRDEFARVVREVGLGLPPEDALANLVRRINSDDLDLMVTAINVQREVGGNLAQILEVISQTIRERVKLKGEIKVLTAQAQMSGYIITALPICLFGAIYLLNHDYVAKLFQGFCGWSMIAGAIVLMTSGFFAMKKITQIEV